MKYTIIKGMHYALPIYTKIVKTDFKKKVFKISFSENAFLANTSEAGAVNKLFGWTYGLSLTGKFVEGKYKNFVHTNSFRLGWAPRNGVIYLYYYEYRDGKLYKEQLKIAITTSGEYILYLNMSTKSRLHGDRVKVICIDDLGQKQKDFVYVTTNNKKLGWWLSPYQGGKNTVKYTYNVKVTQLWKM